MNVFIIHIRLSGKKREDLKEAQWLERARKGDCLNLYGGYGVEVEMRDPEYSLNFLLASKVGVSRFSYQIS